MNIEICADDIEGEEVAHRGLRNREWTQMDANAGARLAPCSGSVSASLRRDLAEAKGERRACRAVALAKAGRVRISLLTKYGQRPKAGFLQRHLLSPTLSSTSMWRSGRKTKPPQKWDASADQLSSRKSLIFMIISDNFNRFFETFGGASPFGVKSGFGAEVVDFRGFSGYFSIVADISHAFFQTGKTCLADAHFEPDKIFSVVSYLDNRRAIARMLEFFVVSV